MGLKSIVLAIPHPFSPRQLCGRSFSAESRQEWTASLSLGSRLQTCNWKEKVTLDPSCWTPPSGNPCARSPSPALGDAPHTVGILCRPTFLHCGVVAARGHRHALYLPQKQQHLRGKMPAWAPKLDWPESSVLPPGFGTARRCVCSPLGPYVVWDALFGHRWLCRAHWGRGYGSSCRRRADENNGCFYVSGRLSLPSNPVQLITKESAVHSLVRIKHDVLLM